MEEIDAGDHRHVWQLLASGQSQHTQLGFSDFYAGRWRDRGGSGGEWNAMVGWDKESRVS
jgi:hypothetical protein